MKNIQCYIGLSMAFVVIGIQASGQQPSDAKPVDTCDVAIAPRYLTQQESKELRQEIIRIDQQFKADGLITSYFGILYPGPEVHAPLVPLCDICVRNGVAPEAKIELGTYQLTVHENAESSTTPQQQTLESEKK